MKRRGPVVDARTDGLRWLSWEVPEEAELSIRRVKQANPASWITTEQLREQRQRLPELAFRRYICNQWVEAENYWLPAGAWQACAGEPDFTDGERIVIGIDIGGERADSAVVWINGELHVGCEVLSRRSGGAGDRRGRPRAGRTLHDRGVPLRPVAGRSDRPGARAARDRVSAFPQHDARMIPACQRLYDAIVEGRIVHGNDPQLNAHVATAVARHGRRGWRIDKANRADKIDAAVSLAMALDRLEDRPAPTRLVGWL